MEFIRQICQSIFQVKNSPDLKKNKVKLPIFQRSKIRAHYYSDLLYKISNAGSITPGYAHDLCTNHKKFIYIKKQMLIMKTGNNTSRMNIEIVPVMQ